VGYLTIRSAASQMNTCGLELHKVLLLSCLLFNKNPTWVLCILLLATVGVPSRMQWQRGQNREERRQA